MEAYMSSSQNPLTFGSTKMVPKVCIGQEDQVVETPSKLATAAVVGASQTKFRKWAPFLGCIFRAVGDDVGRDSCCPRGRERLSMLGFSKSLP